MQTLRIHANTANKMMDKVLYRELSYKLVGMLYKTHDALGQYARENQYGDFFEKLLKENNVQYQREFVLPVAGTVNRADFVADN